jgi:hypothetical protein
MSTTRWPGPGRSTARHEERAHFRKLLGAGPARRLPAVRAAAARAGAGGTTATWPSARTRACASTTSWSARPCGRASGPAGSTRHRARTSARATTRPWWWRSTEAARRPTRCHRVPRPPHSSRPSSWILRVMVLRPMPSRWAASMRRPRVRLQRGLDQPALELARQCVPDLGLGLLRARRRASRARSSSQPAAGIGACRAGRRPDRLARRMVVLHGAFGRRAAGRHHGTDWPGCGGGAASAPGACPAPRAAGPWPRPPGPAPSRSASGRCSRAGARCRGSRSPASCSSAASVMRLASTPSSRALLLPGSGASAWGCLRAARAGGRRRRITFRRWNRSSRNAALAHALLQVLVRGGDHAHIGS